jgi:hypothetical protein
MYQEHNLVPGAQNLTLETFPAGISKNTPRNSKSVTRLNVCTVNRRTAGLVGVLHTSIPVKIGKSMA